MTVLELAKKYTMQKRGAKHSTKAGDQTVRNLLEKDPFGARRIDKVKLSDAKICVEPIARGLEKL